MFLPGIWDERGARRDGGNLVTYSCESGAIAKCARWGYAPWKAGTAVHQACTRMVRADYCGTGVSYTRNGTAIDMFDAQHIQEPANEAGFLFEAGWNENGAACASRTRFDARNANGDAVMPSCWKNLPACSTFEEAKTNGATIGNASRPQARTMCN